METILNLCAEYSRADGGPEAGELPSIGEATAALALAGRRPSRGFAGAIVAPGRSSEEPGGAAQRLWESVERSDEENLKEECSSTESTQQEVEWAEGLDWVRGRAMVPEGGWCGEYQGPGEGSNERIVWEETRDQRCRNEEVRKRREVVLTFPSY